MEKHFQEEMKWLSDKIEYLNKSDKTGVYKDEIRILRRIKSNYEFYKKQNSKLSSELSWKNNPDPGY